MRLLDEQADKPLRRLTIVLTVAEAVELQESLDALFSRPPTSPYEHVSIRDDAHELTVVVYDPADLKDLAPRVKRLILEDR